MTFIEKYNLALERFHKNKFKFKKYTVDFFLSLLRGVPDRTLSEESLKRVDYYIKLDSFCDSRVLSDDIKSYSKDKGAYYIDFHPLIRKFPGGVKFLVAFGDITHIPEHPTFVKSRPINGDNRNSVLLKLNSVRHYYIYPDKKEFLEKKPLAVWRGKSHLRKRLDFVEGFYNKKFCDVGDTHSKSIGKPYHKNFLSIRQQLEYRYIISIEGNDVATNLKWIMNSNSLCMMVRPEFETWFMEGLLIPGVHYVELKPDYSDLEEKINFYNEHPDEALKIIQSAKLYAAQFADENNERAIAHEVMRRYFKLSGQLELT